MHVVVTGASSGIGWSMAKEFHASGAQVTVVGRRKELLDQLAAELGSRCHVAAHDLSDSAHAAAFIPACEAAQGPIDVLINNAGVEITARFVETNPEEGVRLLQTNLLTPLLLIRAVAPAMVARKKGSIVNICSLAALCPLPGHGWYAASKAGLAAFGEASRAELKAEGVQLFTVYPGPVKTPMGDRAYDAFGGRKGIVASVPEGKPEELARLVRKGVEQGWDELIYPSFYRTARWFPRFSRWMTDRNALPNLVRKSAPS